MRTLWALAHAFDSTSKRMLHTLGVTGPQRFVLRIVGHYGRISPGDLAQILHMDPSSLTGVLRRLGEADLIRREKDPFDGRRAILKLTPRGARLNGRLEGTIEAAIQTALTRSSPAELKHAQDVLKRLVATLENLGTSKRR
jgi:DNA-binding MarR family transcriptional regulator